MPRVGVDVGGTHTDLVMIDDRDGRIVLHKVPTTSADPSRGTLDAITEVCAHAGISPGDIDYFMHGTTIATNIVLEHKGARCGLITTEGFRDNFGRVARQDNERKNAEATAERKSILARLAGDFEAVIGNIVGAVSKASSELTSTATTLTKTAETTQRLSTVAAAASEEASANVQSVASATEEMTASISEIGRQVQEASRIANEAVTQARETDARIKDLSKSANRIGDITGMQTATEESVKVINQISGTIWRV